MRWQKPRSTCIGVGLLGCRRTYGLVWRRMGICTARCLYGAHEHTCHPSVPRTGSWLAPLQWIALLPCGRDSHLTPRAHPPLHYPPLQILTRQRRRRVPGAGAARAGRRAAWATSTIGFTGSWDFHLGRSWLDIYSVSDLTHTGTLRARHDCPAPPLQHLVASRSTLPLLQHSRPLPMPPKPLCF